MPNNNNHLPPCEWAQKFVDGKPRLGLSNMYPAPAIIESMARGWDFVWIDAQHGAHDYQSVANCVRATELVGADTVIRPPSHDPGFLATLCDLAPSALMIPMVNSAAEADAVVRATTYPPRGIRSFGGRRVIDLHGRDYYKNTRVGIVAQIETVEAVANVEEIIAVEGVDAVFFGPDDMKVQMGLPVGTPILENPRTLEALKRTAAAARKAGKIAGCVAIAKDDVLTMVDLGYQLLVSGGDSAFVRKMAADSLKMLQDALSARTVAKPEPSVASARSLYAN